MRREVMTVNLYSGECAHSFARSNVHKDPDRPVIVEWTVKDVVLGALALCLYVLIAILMFAL